MKISILKTNLPNPDMALRRLGYGLLQDRHTGQKSYVRRLDRDLYPRFHLYVEEASDAYSVNLHLDQRAPVYSGVTAHSGEYDGAVIEREGERIMAQLSR